MTVHVTEDDIANGLKRHCWSCPVALAVMRTYGEDRVYVNTSNITIGQKRGEIVRTPPEVKAFILDFDKGKPVEPFGFELEAACSIPDDSNERTEA